MNQNLNQILEQLNRVIQDALPRALSSLFGRSNFCSQFLTAIDICIFFSIKSLDDYIIILRGDLYKCINSLT